MLVSKRALSGLTICKQDGLVRAVDDIFEMGISGRTFLQRYGTEAHRDLFGDDFWVDALLPLEIKKFHGDEARWQKNFPTSDIAVITDVRFENEAERIRDLGGQVWRIDRPDLPETEDQHASEQALPISMVDVVVPNYGLYPFKLVVREAAEVHLM